MSTIDNYGVEAGTGELFENRKPGGPEVPTDVTKARMLATNNTVTSGETGGSVVAPTVSDLLNIQIGSLGTGASVFGRKESNTFFFRGIEVEGGLTLHTTRDSIVLGLGDVSVQLPSIADYIRSSGNFSGFAGKVLVVNSAGTGLTFADLSSGGNSNVAKFLDLSDVPSSYTGQAGKMLVVDPSENRLVYAAIPTAGAAGPVGPQGIQGVAGAKGDTGAQGPAGADGAKGDKGDQGEPGTGLVVKGTVPTSASLPTTGQEPGDAYIAANTGHVHMWNGSSFTDLGALQGPAGAKGEKGDIGATGPAGAKGDDGAAGAQGPQGIQGTTGATGAAGATGPAGSKGDKGADGAQGTKGDTGATGPKGDTGAAGLGFSSATVNNSGRLIITKTDNTTIDAGNVVGPKGDTGPAGSGSGTSATKFTQLTDVPQAYTGQGGKFLAVKSDASGVEFVAAPSSGTGSSSINNYSILLQVNGNGQITTAAAILEMPAGWTFVSNPTTTSIQIRKTATGRIKHASFWGVSNAAGDTFESSAHSNTNFVTYPQDDFDLVTISLAAVANAKTSSGGKVYVDFMI